jgi:hypothetical protein
MDYDKYLQRLWALRWLVAIAALVAIYGGLNTRYDIHPTQGKVERKVVRYATAQTQVLIDSPRSPITDASLNIAPLSTRAVLYAAFLRNEEARTPILKAAGLPHNAPVAIIGGDQATTGAPAASSKTPGAISAGLTPEQQAVVFTAQEGLPLVNVRAQAPTLDEAIKLADGAAKGAADYLGSLQTSRSTPQSDRVTVRQLGDASGGVIEQGPGRRAIVTAALGIFAGLCLLILLLDGGVRAIRAPRRARRQQDSDAAASAA